MTNLLWVAAGGAVGAVLRYLLSMKVAAETGAGFPWSTLTVNMVGCLVIGIMWSVTEHKTISDGFLLFVMVGLIGSFTTFSTYGLEGIQLIQSGKLMAGFGYVLLSNLIGLLLVAIGKSMLDRFFAVMGG
ncbi:fluoride efflux transporter CrcB [Rhodohalobacter sp. 8-1]|uniref:fluoride efflux transporter CrcB n=1 Tax=Rhodohalobacter sp. 8-1 TaxID=3131972 RepID=UPI0030EE38AE